MASDSQEASFLIKYHRGGVFVRDPLSYDYEILSEIPNVDLVSLGLAGFISLLETEFTSSVKSLFYLVPGLDFHLGLKPLKCEADFKECVECGVNNDHVLHVYASHSEFDLNETTTEQNDNSGSDLEDDDYNVYDYCSSEESDTASVDHLSDDEEEVLDVRTKKIDRAPKKKATKATYPTKFEKIMQEIKDLSIEAHKHLMERNPESWSRAFFRTDRVCDAVENGISECFNSLIVEARRKPIINMLEDIRIGLMERMQRMREKHAKWADGICPNIRKKFEKLKDQHRNWRVVPSGESRFEVRNGYEGFKVDERLRTCTCRGWQLTGIPCQHGLAALYFLHREPEEYVSEWYRKDKFVSAYSNYIEGLNGLDQWPATSYQKPLPPIIRRMPGRPPHKRKRDAFENDGNRTRLSRKGQVNHCTLCGKSGHNQRACPSKNEEGSAIDVVTSSTSTRGGTGSARGGSASTRGGNTFARGENTSVRGGSSSARGGKTSLRGGKTSARGGLASARGGKTSARDGSTSARGGKTPTRGGMTAASSAPSSSSVGFEMSASQGVRMTGSGLRTVNGKVVRTRGRGDGSRSRMYPNGIRPIGYGISWDPVNGKTMLGDSMGIPRPAWPEGITLEDVRIHVAESKAQAVIPLSTSQPLASQEELQDEELVQELQDEEPVHVERRVSERLKLKCLKKNQNQDLD
ncbi:multidrug resistance-associated protein 5 [Tanacetum coccineum]